jgi:hypothetical protein
MVKEILLMGSVNHLERFVVSQGNNHLQVKWRVQVQAGKISRGFSCSMAQDLGHRLPLKRQASSMAFGQRR